MTVDTHRQTVVDFYDTHPINEGQILEKLQHDGVDLSGLTEDILQHYDMDHFDGLAAIDSLAQKIAAAADSHVLDVASGMGGPARYLAQHYGCRVTGIDLTASRVDGAQRLTKLVGLSEVVQFRNGDALANPFPDAHFDAVIGQEAWCHIPDKARLIAECVRVTRNGGYIAFTDILERCALNGETAARLQRDMGFAELGSLARYQDLLAANGCTVLEAEEMSDHWAVILRERLQMYRGLKEQTISSFGAAHYQAWDDFYAFFVGLYESGDLGGGRFLARKSCQ
ncbi:MAG: methyltransferase domain-containing protein [Rhodospirillaceae bacterium]|jgi:ubiquinone/menaquinone biosynthesis C-methylase UbiE|nr:methyltransferase domain-containing protein [Rhodospirillaceae bacterium]MBT3492668.1 methyltransferase domain-containing protein [Rhodospirillaceae bacterium]MBT3779637.1 methyltransferase domain-containing protein [Rhodospirillaceae bacterium]MBT3975930.1 methyltransferase domain-containing protein [Rhodospirillaceae bacterium]MBT4170633.1 methyltransferase domain-containing protein [Rhodospirillaceae bacterium]